MVTTYKLYRNNKLKEYICNFKDIKLKINRNELKIPNCQTSLEDNKINDLVNLYQKDSLLWRFRNKVVIGNLNKQLYIIDGQHRIHAASRLSDNYDDDLIFCEYYCKDENSMRKLFEYTNKDSYRNELYINNEESIKIKMDNFIKKIKEYYPQSLKYFTNKITPTSVLKTYSSFRDDINRIKLFEKYDNVEDLIDYILKKNKEFYEHLNYKQNLLNNESCYYKNELIPLRDEIVFTTNNNNFIDYLNDNTIRPFHQYRKGKKRIQKKLKRIVWNYRYPENKSMECPISNCNNIITDEKFDCGHIIAEWRNGETEQNNLHPICSTCNSRMGQMNWCNYDIHSYKKIKIEPIE